jgi:hypothetical protein
VCWVSPAETTATWMGKVPSIRVRDPRGERPWAVIEGVAGFDFQQGAWIAVEDVDLTRFIQWVLHEQTTPHQVFPRYRSIELSSSRGYRRRQMIWTTHRSVDEEASGGGSRCARRSWRRWPGWPRCSRSSGGTCTSG